MASMLKNPPSPLIRAVAVPFPMQGHINPLLHLCRRLVPLGFSIIFVNTHSNHNRMKLSYAESHSGIKFLSIEDGCGKHDWSKGKDSDLQDALMAAEKMEGPFQELLQQLNEEEPVSCIISDGFLGWSQDVANRFGIPRAALWCSSVTYFHINVHLPELISQGYIPVNEQDDSLITFIEGIKPLHPRDLPFILQVESSSDPGFRNRAKRARRLYDAAWVFFNTFQELEFEPLQALKGTGNFASAGPLFLSSFLQENEVQFTKSGLWEEDHSCIRWLDTKPRSSVIYVSFGSLVTLNAAQVLHLAGALEGSKQPFLWVFRPNLVSYLSEEFMEAFKERTKDQGLVITWAPQLQVLAHASVGGFVSHCGWNSTLESVSMGVPIIGWPCIAEQNLNCKFVTEDWKVGLRLVRDEEGMIDQKQIEDAIMKLMTGEEGHAMKSRAEHLRDVARRAISEGGSSQCNLEQFARDMHERQCQDKVQEVAEGTKGIGTSNRGSQ